jgi:hypothetical protein
MRDKKGFEQKVALTDPPPPYWDIAQMTQPLAQYSPDDSLDVASFSQVTRVRFRLINVVPSQSTDEKTAYYDEVQEMPDEDAKQTWAQEQAQAYMANMEQQNQIAIESPLQTQAQQQAMDALALASNPGIVQQMSHNQSMSAYMNQMAGMKNNPFGTITAGLQGIQQDQYAPTEGMNYTSALPAGPIFSPAGAPVDAPKPKPKPKPKPEPEIPEPVQPKKRMMKKEEK